MLIRIGAQTVVPHQHEQIYTLAFDGVDDTIHVPLSESLAFAGSFTVQAKIENFVESEQYAVILRAENRPGDFFTTLGSATGMGFYGVTGTVQNYIKTSLEDGRQYVLSYVYDEPANQCRLYIDGELRAQWDTTGNVRPHTQSDLWIASHSGSSRFTGGLLAAVQLWSRPLTPEETVGLADRGMNSPALVGYWPLNEGYGAVAHDHSGYQNHGTIVGATWQEVP